MKNKKIMGLMALGIVAIFGISLVVAYQGDYSTTGPNYSEDRHEAMEQVFDNLDYNAWVLLITEDGKQPGVLNKINADNFELFVEAHEAGISGDFVKASELRAKLGLGQGKMSGNGTGQKMNKDLQMKQGHNGNCLYGN
ncbi:MAG: hypothetical protein U9Q99_00110 [Nanoarchaeota archaeon]|nr:hypothetical protein [Nanoarchaeota archaeon]